MIDTTKIYKTPEAFPKAAGEEGIWHYKDEPIPGGYSLTAPSPWEYNLTQTPQTVYRTAGAFPETAGATGQWAPGTAMPGGYSSFLPLATQARYNPLQAPLSVYKDGGEGTWLPGEPMPGGYALPTKATTGYAAPSTFEQMQQAPPGGETFPYPQQWGWASEALQGLAETGMPGMTPEYTEQAWLPYQRRGQQEAMQAREEAGLSGMRWGTPLAGQLEDIWGGASERFGGEMERMRMQDIAGQRAARLGATGQLAGLGGQYAQLPLDVSQQMMGMGAMQQQMQQQEIAPLLQEFMRTQPEYSPLLQMMFGGATGLPTGPQMFQPSAGGNIMSLLSMALMLGLFK